MVGEDRAVFAGLIAMSRIGKKPIPIPAGVTVKVGPDAVEVQGPKGKLLQRLPPGIVFSTEDGALVAKLQRDDNELRKIGYVGIKRYVRATITPAGNDAGNIFVTAEWVLRPLRTPAANPPA